MYASQKDLSDALLAISEQMNRIENSVAKIGAGLLAVKAQLAIEMNPSNPAEALGRIEAIEARAEEKDPNRGQRKAILEAIDLVKMIEEHGGAKEA